MSTAEERADEEKAFDEWAEVGRAFGEALKGLDKGARRLAISCEVLEEQAAQDEKWGEQNHHNGTGSKSYRLLANVARANCDQSAEDGDLTWRHIASEEFYEALAESDPALLRAELVQTGAVLQQWIAAIDRAEEAKS